MIGIKKLSILILVTQFFFATSSSSLSVTESYDESSSEGTYETTNESTEKLEINDTENEIHENQISADSREQVIDDGQVTDGSVKESDSNNQPTKESASRAVGVQASGSGTSQADPRIVENSAELRTAIEIDKVSYIQLADSDEVFRFEEGSSYIDITSDVTIDGNGRTLSYNDSKRNRALQVTKANVSVKLQNMIFGSEDYSVDAYDYFGFCQGNGNSNVTIEVENINYYSTSAAQPFHNRGTGSKIVFSGTNYFTVQTGSYSQEFAECNHFLFKENSHTKIEHATGWANSIETSGSNFSFELEAGAVVDYNTTSSQFVDNYSANGTMKIGEGASLKISGGETFVNSSRPMNLQVDKGGKLDLTFARKFNFSDASTFNFAKDSTLNMAVTDDSQVFSNTISAANFIIDNAYRLSFNVSKSTNSEPVNAGFTFFEFVDDITGYGITAGNTPINTIINQGDTITSDKGDFMLSPLPDFTDDEKTTIRGAKSIVLQRLPNPAVIRDVKQVVKDTSAAFNLTDYLTNNNVITGVDYLLFSKQQDTESFNVTDKIAEQKIEAKAEEAEEAEEATELTEAEITSSVEFTGLAGQTEYWLYVQIKTGFESGDSEWYEVPFTTKTDTLNVSFPTEMFFNTEMSEEGRRLIVTSQRYRVKNNSAYPIELKIDTFSENSDSGIILLENTDGDTQDHLFLQLAKDNEEPTTLIKDLKDASMGTLEIDQQINLRFTGEYFGNAGKEIKPKYNMILEFTRTGD
ncbi:hypothetical protein [Enterococcus sp. AD013-P3]|uniref:hypothetical protein n=1 Tax=Enterococcus sp. AD013-P3 TaxID=3411036 RepID=UPI003B94B705